MSNTGQIIKSKKSGNYTAISNKLIQSIEITLCEKGLLCYLLSLPDDWVVYKKNLGENLNESESVINKSFKGLQSKGYIKSIRLLNDKKQFSGWQHIVNDNPLDELPESENLFIPSKVEIEKIRDNKTQNALAYLDLFSSISGRTGFKANKSLIDKFNSRLKEDYTLEQFGTAIRNAYADDFHKSKQFSFLTPLFFTRVDKLERWMNEKVKPVTKEMTQHIGTGGQLWKA